MSGMTSIYVGVSGLQSAQTSLNTTSHNLANVYTEGYTRQLSFTAERNYSNIGSSSTGLMQVGLGVSSSATSRVRAILLDQQFRREIGKQGFYESGYEAVTELETIIGETEGVQFQNSVENMWSALNEMAKTPDSTVTRSELVMYAESFMDRAKAIYSEMEEYQYNLNQKILDNVDKINQIGDEINALNLKIAGVEIGVEAANDFRDRRDVLLDELSKYVKVTYEEQPNFYVNVKVEGTPFVTEGAVFHMGTAQLDGDKGSMLASCIWPQLNNEEVYNLEEPINAGNGNDIGSLKGYLLARGDFTAKYTDIPHEEDYDMSTDDGKNAYYEAVDKYDRTVGSCAVAKAEAMFDTLINEIVTAINDIISPLTDAPSTVTEFTDADGNTYSASDVKILDTNTSTGDDGKMPPEELFIRTETPRFIEVTGDDGETYYMYNEKNSFGNESLYTISNIEMNQVVVEDYSKLPFKSLEGDIDLSKGEKLVDEWNALHKNLEPDSLAKLTYKEFYNELVYEVGNMGSLFYSVAVSQETTSAQIDDARAQIAGVSSEEELTNMIRYQNAYNASSRYINTVAQMLEHIIEKLG